MSWDQPQAFIIDLHVASEHIDELGHANNAVLCDVARTLCLATLPEPRPGYRGLSPPGPRHGRSAARDRLPGSGLRR